MKNPRLTSHKPEAIARATLFFSQMATLEELRKHIFRAELQHEAKKTDMRSTINSETVARLSKEII
jgi:hypothetical protein